MLINSWADLWIICLCGKGPFRSSGWDLCYIKTMPPKAPEIEADGTASNSPRKVSPVSILAGDSGRSNREDAFGNKIDRGKGKKNHRCSFQDEINPRSSVFEVKEVTAIKGAAALPEDDAQPKCCSVM